MFISATNSNKIKFNVIFLYLTTFFFLFLCVSTYKNVVRFYKNSPNYLSRYIVQTATSINTKTINKYNVKTYTKEIKNERYIWQEMIHIHSQNFYEKSRISSSGIKATPIYLRVAWNAQLASHFIRRHDELFLLFFRWMIMAVIGKT